MQRNLDFSTDFLYLFRFNRRLIVNQLYCLHRAILCYGGPTPRASILYIRDRREGPPCLGHSPSGQWWPAYWPYQRNGHIGVLAERL